MLITNAHLITWTKPNQILEDHAVLVSGEKIVEIGKSADLIARFPEETRLDAAGQYVMPGNIDAHGHYYSAFAVGMSVPGEAPITLPTIRRSSGGRSTKPSGSRRYAIRL